MNDIINLKPVIASLIFAGVGIVVLVFAFWIIDKLTPYNLWREIIEKGNTALSILAAGFLLSLGIIIAAAIHG